MKQKINKYLLAHKEDDAGFLTVGMNQEGFSHKLVYDYLKIPWLLDNFLIFKDGYLDWFCNKKNWDKIVDIVLNRIKNDKTFGKKILDKTLEIGRKLEIECDRALKNIKKGIVIFKDWQEFISLLHQIYSIGMVPAISDILHFSFTRFMEGLIGQKIEQLKLNRPVGDYFSVSTTPVQENLFQKSEKELLKIAVEIKNKKLNKNEIRQKIEKYLEKYGWIEYGHLGPSLTARAVMKKIRQYLKADPVDKLKELNSRKEKLIKSQRKFEKELKLGQKEKQLFQTARDFGQHKAHRLAMAYLANYTINEALGILAKKYGYTIQELRNLSRDEFLEMVKSGEGVSKNILKQRQKFCVNHVISYGKVKVYTGRAARDFVRKYVPREEIDASQQIIKGSVACAGKAMGRVKIINNSADVRKMNKGDILVAIQTTPQLLPAMRKAAAFVTDIGGLTSHAAIVSRELGIPCVIGTKIATKVLRDGDLVEVDAERGMVKIVKKAK